ncbi:family 43 glycosylhydrolase [Domibacillus sp. A3M-37]|uniref:glucosamine inositolphosphorylceramide transferase family protein n=1 Tax=Domibacillus sp. A3M-37 TaxID=2962037 RepID=UPI0020B728E4|nr:family 43 glycosylhydrolase [Domibacillus sp. A3M-37]MCP3761327.1 family 43 glycosylhydrolase [Domibacillus sp. A3M-37]
MLKTKTVMMAGILVVSSVMAGFAYNKKYSPAIWSIHVLKTNAPITSASQVGNLSNPVLKPEDVTDVTADFVADPFLMEDQGTYYLFFEVLNQETKQGDIGLATSKDGEKWQYEKIVLNEDFHLSYPHVFKHENSYYMIPESVEAGGIYLYKATQFPYKWERVKQLVGGPYTDASIFQYENKWWMYTAGLDNETLHLFYADELHGEWTQHAKSPLITNDLSNSRPGGRVVVEDGTIYRYVQDDGPYYGYSVKVFQVQDLSETVYAEKELGVILEGSGEAGDWREDGMHHIDHLKLADKQWLIAVDGHQFHHQNYAMWKLKSMFP